MSCTYYIIDNRIKPVMMTFHGLNALVNRTSTNFYRVFSSRRSPRRHFSRKLDGSTVGHDNRPGHFGLRLVPFHWVCAGVLPVEEISVVSVGTFTRPLAPPTLLPFKSGSARKNFLVSQRPSRYRV